MNRQLSLLLALAASALLLIGLLAGSRSESVHAQQGDVATPTPTTEPGPVFDIQILPTEGKISPPKYPNLDSDLNHIIEQARTGQLTARAAAANAPIHREESVAVTLYITEGYAQDVWDYLEQSGASPRNIGADYIEAYIPVSLLAEASEAGRCGRYPNHHSTASVPGHDCERRRGGARCPLMACRRL